MSTQCEIIKHLMVCPLSMIARSNGAILKNKKIKSLVIIVVGGLSSQLYVIRPLKFQAQTLRA